MAQLKLNFSRRPPKIDNGKRLERLSFTCSEELKTFLDSMVSAQRTDRSKLIHRYVVEGMQKDLAEILMPQPHLDESLRTILKQGF